jgi:Type II secretion system (T2SS), protein E, N-terminal domain
MNLRDLPLGSLIVRDGIVRPADVRDALVEAQDTDRRLGEVLLERGWIRERDLARLLAEQERLEFVDLGMIDLDDRAVDLLGESVARANGAVAYAFAGRVLLVAVADPTNEPAMDAIRDAVERRVRFVVATASEVAAAQRDAYGEPLGAPVEQLA